MKGWGSSLAFCLTLHFCCAQEIPPVPEGKAVVYIVRTSAYGFANSFAYLDSARLIGKFGAQKYMRYECLPGSHLFWAVSENNSFVEAHVDAGRMYFLHVDAEPGETKSIVNLIPVDPRNRDVMMRIFKLMNKKSAITFTSAELASDAKALKAAIKRGLAKHASDKAKGEVMGSLTADMYYPLK
jgi:hypothetical protein